MDFLGVALPYFVQRKGPYCALFVVGAVILRRFTFFLGRVEPWIFRLVPTVASMGQFFVGELYAVFASCTRRFRTEESGKLYVWRKISVGSPLDKD